VVTLRMIVVIHDLQRQGLSISGRPCSWSRELTRSRSCVGTWPMQALDEIWRRQYTRTPACSPLQGARPMKRSGRLFAPLMTTRKAGHATGPVPQNAGRLPHDGARVKALGKEHPSGPGLRAAAGPAACDAVGAPDPGPVDRAAGRAVEPCRGDEGLRQQSCPFPEARRERGAPASGRGSGPRSPLPRRRPRSPLEPPTPPRPHGCLAAVMAKRGGEVQNRRQTPVTQREYSKNPSALGEGHGRKRARQRQGEWRGGEDGAQATPQTQGGMADARSGAGSGRSETVGRRSGPGGP